MLEYLEKKRNLDREVGERVAEIVLQMDPWDPLFKEFKIVFSKDYDQPEDGLDEQSALRLYMWAAGVVEDPSFIYLTDFIRNTQGNATLKEATNDKQWIYGRSAVATITLFTKMVSRLAFKYKEILAKKDSQFDSTLAVE